MTQLKHAVGAWILASAFLPSLVTHAATYYVAPTGNDALTCSQAKSASTPKKTIPAGVKCLSGGDTLIVKAGTYINQEIFNPPAGTASTYTTIKADPAGGLPVIVPNGAKFQRGFYCNNGASCRYIEVRGFEISKAYNSVKLFGNSTFGYPHHLRFINNIMHDSFTTNVFISTSDSGYHGGDHLFQGNTFYRTGVGEPGYGPGHNTIYNPGNRTIVEKNKFRNLAHGVGIYHSGKSIQNVTIRSNVFYDIGRSTIDTWQQGNGTFSGIHVSSPGGGHKIYNNIIYRSGDQSSFGGIKVGNAYASDTNHIYNNTIYDIKNSGAYAIKISATSGLHLVKNNITYLAGRGIYRGSPSNNLTTNPSFTNAAGADFRLLSNSTAINKGVILSAVPTDFAGARRPAGSSHDIGAYEAGGTSTLASPTSLSVQ
jgi:Right handed beta helix region